MKQKIIFVITEIYFHLGYGISLKDSRDITHAEACEFQIFEAKCAVDEVIVMTNALYGRMELGKCVVADLGYIGCQGNVLDVADRKCSGRRSCSVSIPDKAMTQRQPCLPELKTYLQASYYCQKVISVERPRCRRCDFVKVTEQSGYIGNVITHETGCGAPDCPWMITVLPGQRVNITLINFAWDAKGAQNQIHDVEGGCHVYGTLKEETAERSTTICGDNEREKHVYTSVTNSVELRIVGKTSPERSEYFLFKYEAVGCVDPEAPNGGWMKRVGTVVTMGCNHSSDTWKLSCIGYKWKGEHPDCNYEKSSQILGVIDSNIGKLPYGLSVVVIIAVAVLIGCFILIIGLVIVKRRRAERQGRTHYPPPSMPPSYKETMTGHATIQSQHNYERRLPVDQTKVDVKNGASQPGYNTMWQRPLPAAPINSNGNTDYMQRPGPVHHGYNTIASVKPVHGPGAHGERPLEYGNNTLARRDCDTDSSQDDPRYFQLDPETGTL